MACCLIAALGGGVLPMWWVIHMCRGFDPLFSLWHDRSRSFWGIFLIHQQQSYLLGYKNYQFLQKSIFLAPNSIFSSIFFGSHFQRPAAHPHQFSGRVPPPRDSSQVIIWTKADLFLNGPLGTNFDEIQMKIWTSSFKKMHLKMLSMKWRPFCLDLNVIRSQHCFR